MKYVLLSLLSLTAPDDVEQGAYSWQIQKLQQVDVVEIGSLKEHSCEAIKTQPEIRRVFALTGPTALAMDEPLVSAFAGKVPRPHCGLSLAEAEARTLGWMAEAYNQGATAVDLIEAWPHHEAETIIEFTSRLHRTLGLRRLVLDITFGPNAGGGWNILRTLALFRAFTLAEGLELAIIITPQDGEAQLAYVKAMNHPPDVLIVQNWELPPRPRRLLELLELVRMDFGV